MSLYLAPQSCYGYVELFSVFGYGSPGYGIATYGQLLHQLVVAQRRRLVLLIHQFAQLLLDGTRGYLALLVGHAHLGATM